MLNDDNRSVRNSSSFGTNKELFGFSEQNYCVLLHLSQFAGLVVPVLGFALPLFMWISQKDNNATVDTHGINVMNWILSLLIYSVICTVLSLILIGMLLFVVLAVLGVIFPIIAASKANENEVWQYPMAMKFLKKD